MPGVKIGNGAIIASKSVVTLQYRGRKSSQSD
ncbi:hypothetical protein [Pseudoalteromonas luteoviolacea]